MSRTRADALNSGRENIKPLVTISTLPKRPTLGTLGDVLKAIAERHPSGCTRITGFSKSHWSGIQPGEPDELELRIEGATTCLDDTDAITIHIREGVTVATARALLKALSRELKSYRSLEQFTPIDPPSADADFIQF